MSDKTTKVRALRDFSDAGTERNFTKGTEYELPEGEAANYLAAGLVEIVEAPAPTPAVDASSDTAPARKRT